MEKNQSSFKPQCGVFGRVKKAITFRNPLEQSPPSPPPLNYPNSPECPKVSTKPVPIEFDHSVFSNIKVGLKDKAIRAGGVDHPGESEQGRNGNTRFSDYINRAKMKVRRSMTVVGTNGGGKGVSRLQKNKRQ
ncbi:hypothetical protein QQ045_001360 [Rhodiola kirilowii]